MDINNILNQSAAQQATDRAVDAWRRIQEKPTSITLIRNGTPLAAQTFRLEYGRIGGDVQGEAGQSASQRVTLFGMKDHPDEDDSDVKQGDRFVLLATKVQYRVLDVVHTLGEVQARCEGLS